MCIVCIICTLQCLTYYFAYYPSFSCIFVLRFMHIVFLRFMHIVLHILCVLHIVNMHMAPALTRDTEAFWKGRERVTLFRVLACAGPEGWPEDT
jgi:hypothetical protein